MSRLIDEDEFYARVLEGRKFAWQMHDLPRHEIIVQTVYEDLADFVRTIPTAYSVEAVVGELERELDYHVKHQLKWENRGDELEANRHRQQAIAFDTAIAIVRRGGRNERTD